MLKQEIGLEDVSLIDYDKSNDYKRTVQRFDINSKIPGKPRDKERFVRGSDGRTYYTDDHYETFTEII